MSFWRPYTILTGKMGSIINLISSRYHWDQLDAKLIVLDINFPVRMYNVPAAILIPNAIMDHIHLLTSSFLGSHNLLGVTMWVESRANIPKHSKIWEFFKTIFFQIPK
jgi:hypothetical protein